MEYYSDPFNIRVNRIIELYQTTKNKELKQELFHFLMWLKKQIDANLLKYGHLLKDNKDNMERVSDILPRVFEKL
jgi:hypothetical protein